MSLLTDAENTIYNDGERLIPGVSHDPAEVVRHKSSYALFHKLILADLLTTEALRAEPVRILEIGCGTGHGSRTLSSLPNVEILALDFSPEAIVYAQKYYGATNITYKSGDATAWVKANTEAFDYVVSRHALEHIVDGLNLPAAINVRQRVLVNVPYREPAGNPYHLVNDITEADFSAYIAAEFFYEGMDGVTHRRPDDCDQANSILCVATMGTLLPATDLLNPPVPAWRPDALEALGLDNPGLRAELAATRQSHKAEVERLAAAEASLRQSHQEEVGRLSAWEASLRQTHQEEVGRLSAWEASLIARETEVRQLAESATANLDAARAVHSAQQDATAGLASQLEALTAQTARMAAQLDAIESERADIAADREKVAQEQEGFDAQQREFANRRLVRLASALRSIFPGGS